MQPKNKYIAIVLFVTLFAFARSISAQSVWPGGWMRLAGANGEISFELPSDGEYFYDRDGFVYDDVVSGKYFFREVQMLNAVSDGTFMSVEVYSVPEPGQYLDHLLQVGGFTSKKVETKSKKLIVKNVTLGPERREWLKKRPVYFEAKYVATKTHIFIATVWKRGAANAVAERFLSSVRILAGEPSGIATSSGDVPAVPIESLRPITLSEVAGKLTKQEAELVPENPEWDRNDPDAVTVLSSAWAGNVQPVNNSISKGKVALQVTYGEKGRISRVEYISGLTGNPSRNTLFALLRYKFLPRLQDGKPAPTNRKLVFQF